MKGDPVKVRVHGDQDPIVLIVRAIQDIIKTAWDNGINMFDTAEAYAAGQSEIEMCVLYYLVQNRPC